MTLQALLVCGYLTGVGSSLAVGAFGGLRVPAAALAGALACLLACLLPALACHGGSGRRLLLAVCGFVLLGLALGSVRLHMIGGSELSGYAGRQVTLVVTVTRAPKAAPGKISFIARTEGGEFRGNDLALSENIMVEFYCRGDCGGSGTPVLPSEGKRYRVTGVLSLPRAGQGGDFDYGQYLARRGVHAVITVQPGGYELLEPRRGLAGAVDALRRHAVKILGAGARGAAGGLLKGMVLGDTSAVPANVVEDLRDSGLLHLLAVSGQNVVLLGFVVMLLCRAAALSRRVAAAVSMVVICAYVPLTGADPSIARAGFVGVAGLLATLSGRQASRYYLLAVSAAVLMTLNPNNLMEPGFQLSYAAVLAIFLVAPAFKRLLGLLPSLLAEAVAVSAAAGLATAPITLAHFQQVSLITVVANVAAAPVAGPVMLLGTLSVLAAPVSITLSSLLNLIASFCTGYLIQVARYSAAVPGAVYVGASPGALAISLYYGMLVVVSVLTGKTRTPGASAWRRPLRIWLLVLAVLLIVGGLACYRGPVPDPPAGYTVSFLDVGQGDATLIQVPGGATVLVDGGPGAAVLDQLRQSGVKAIDAVVLSHPHADHLKGLTMALERFDVGAVYDAAAPSSSPLYADFLRTVERRQVPYNVVKKGDVLTFGELTLEVFSPGAGFAADDINDNSVVLVASYRGMDVLLPGDAESAVLSSLALPETEALKVSHHGSRDDGLARLLDAVQPGIAVISVGADNEYGHPSGSTMDTLAASGARIYRTDRDGTIRLSLDGERVVVATARSGAVE